MLQDLAKEAVKVITAAVVSRWSQSETKLFTLDFNDESFSHNIGFAQNWSSQISLIDAGASQPLDDLYVDIGLITSSARSTSLTTSRTKSLRYSTTSYRNILLLGGPGAGKTTSIKRLIRQLFLEDAEGFLEDVSFPLLIRCREIDSSRDIYAAILSALGVTINWSLPSSWPMQQRVAYQHNQCERLTSELLNERSALVLIDGLDELPQEIFLRCVTQVSRLMSTATASRFYVTARTGAVNQTLDHCQTMRLLPLKKHQIVQLSKKWLKKKSDAEAFVAAALASPYADSLNRPLNVAHLCLVFKAYGEIPNVPVLVYQRFINLHLEEWDRERGVRRQTAYALFTAERKRQFLAAVAYRLSHVNQTSIISRQNLIDAYEAVYQTFQLPKDDALRVAQEIESHTGLLVGTGFDRFEFSHKSLQEFLVADFIVRSPNILASFPNWRHLPDECAIAAALSADPSEFLWALVVSTYHELETPDKLWDIELILELFWGRFLARVAIERPGFVASEPYVLSVLYLEALCWSGRSSNAAPRAIRKLIRPAMDHLLEVPNTVSQVRDMIHRYQVKVPEAKHLVLWINLKRLRSADLTTEINVGLDLFAHSK